MVYLHSNREVIQLHGQTSIIPTLQRQKQDSLKSEAQDYTVTDYLKQQQQTPPITLNEHCSACSKELLAVEVWSFAAYCNTKYWSPSLAAHGDEGIHLYNVTLFLNLKIFIK